MTSDDRGRSLADQAATWVPPWERTPPEPAAPDDPAASDEPDAVGDPAASGEPVGEPAAVGEPFAVGEPAASDEPAVVGDPAAVDEAAVVGEPAAVDEAAVVGQPAAVDEPEVLGERAARGESVDELVGSPAAGEPAARPGADGPPTVEPVEVSAGVAEPGDEPLADRPAQNSFAVETEELVEGSSSDESGMGVDNDEPEVPVDVVEPGLLAGADEPEVPVDVVEPRVLADADEPAVLAGAIEPAVVADAGEFGVLVHAGEGPVFEDTATPADEVAFQALDDVASPFSDEAASEGTVGVELVSAGPLALVGEAELRGALEAILLVVEEPVGEIMLAQVLEQPTERITALLAALAEEYESHGRGFELRKAAGGWRLYTRPEYAPYVERFVLDGQQVRLTQAALETLAVVAYKQPVTRSRISAIRGVNCDGVIRTLVSRGLVEECGTEPESGAFLYRTTILFLEKLGLNSVEDLPPLAPFLPDDVSEIADAPN